MSVKIRLMRTGKIRTPYFRIVVSDSRKARNGLSIEEIGRYSPSSEPSLIEVKSDRAQYWLGVGAQPTEAVSALLKITGDYQRAHKQSGEQGTLKSVPPRSDKKIAYEAAVKEAMNEPKDGATTLKKKAAEKLAAKSAPAAEVDNANTAAENNSEVKSEAKAEEKAEVKVEAPADALAAESNSEATPEVASE